MFSSKEKSMQWINKINNPTWKSIFGESTPKETNIDMVILRGKTILIRAFAPIDGMTYPHKWDTNGFNSFDFEILINETSNIYVENYLILGSFDISADLPNITIKVKNGCTIKCQAKSLSIININGFYDERI